MCVPPRKVCSPARWRLTTAFDLRKRWEYSPHCWTNNEMVAQRSYRTCPKLNYSDTVELVFDWVTLSAKPFFFAYEHVEL